MAGNLGSIKEDVLEATASNPDRSADPQFLIFSYGSNSAKQMHERTGCTCSPIPAYLPEHVRIFAGYSARWDGAVASVHPHAGGRVYGCAFKLTARQLRALDAYEGGYARCEREMTLLRSPDADDRASASTRDGQEYVRTCYVYIKANTTFSEEEPPSLEYMRAIRRMLSERAAKAETKVLIRAVVNNEVTVVGHFWDDEVVMHEGSM